MRAHGFISPSPVLIMAGAIVGLLLALAGVTYLYQSEVKDHAKYRAEVAAASKKADDENNTKLDAANGNTARVAALYAADGDRVAGLARSRLDGVRRELRDCQAAAQASRSASGADERPADERPVAGGSEAEIRQLETDCAKTTLQFFGLRAYVRGLCASFGCE